MSSVNKIQLHGRRGKGTAESFSRFMVFLMCDPGSWCVHILYRKVKSGVQNK